MLLLGATQYFDDHEFDPKGGYAPLSERYAKIRHIQLHVVKAAMKLSEGDPIVIRTEVVPDCAIYRSQLINWLGLTAGQAADMLPYERIFVPLRDARRLGTESASHSSLGQIVRANGLLATYLERLEHGAPAPDTVGQAAVALHYAALRLGGEHNINIAEAQLHRLEVNLGRPVPDNYRH